MNESQLAALFRNALRASLAVPLLGGAVACGGSTVTIPGTDSGKPPPGPDAGPHSDANGDAGSGCNPAEGCACSGGCTPVETCVDGNVQCSCSCPPPPPEVDSGNPCKPNIYLCSNTGIPLSCFDGGLAAEAGAELPADQCMALCGAYAQCYIGSVDGGVNELRCSTGCATGRSFAGMDPPRAAARTSALARYFAETAQLEAASVDAFLILRNELTAHGAPAALVDAATAAARDEVRHARLTGRIARRYGSCPKMPRASKRPVRDLEAIALENAVEGCVRETFGALVAHHQASVARDVEVRVMMATIADDETRHAALGWAVATWAESQLDEAGRARVRAARAQAVETLRADAAATVPVSLSEVAGLPDAASASRMLSVLEATLWS